MVAHRTSPTNIGMYLLSTVAARDFGWLGTIEALERIEATLATMRQLELYRGHLFNWYDTRDLHPLDPKYISSVDSGNLAGHLLVLSNSCRELVQKPTIDARMLTGLQDSIWLLREALAGSADTRALTRSPANISATQSTRWLSCSTRPADALGWASLLAELRERARTMDDIAQTLQQEEGDTQVSDLRVWAAAARACVESHVRDMEILIPWSRLPFEGNHCHGGAQPEQRRMGGN